MNLRTENMVEHEDGSLSIEMSMDMDMLVLFAKIGLKHVLSLRAAGYDLDVEEVSKGLGDGHPHTEGAGDAEAGEGGDTTLSR